MSRALLLSAKGLSKVYQRKGDTPVEVISNLNLDIFTGDRIAILGKSGAGKSTLLHILGTLESPTSGDLEFQGENVFRWSEGRLAQFRNHQIGFVFQFHYLMLEFTALENAAMPGLIAGQSKASAYRRAEDLLAWVGLQDRLHHKPSQLSGGEQSRVAIVRALMMKPQLLLTDEMTGNLDSATGAQIFELIHRVHQELGLAIISVTHDEALAKKYARVLRLVDGRLSQVS